MLDCRNGWGGGWEGTYIGGQVFELQVTTRRAGWILSWFSFCGGEELDLVVIEHTTSSSSHSFHSV